MTAIITHTLKQMLSFDRHTLGVLSQLAASSGSSEMTDEQIVAYANEKVSEAFYRAECHTDAWNGC
jgi:hypothetical protein